MLDAGVNILRGSAPELSPILFLTELGDGTGYCEFVDMEDPGYGWAYYDDNYLFGEGRGVPFP